MSAILPIDSGYRYDEALVICKRFEFEPQLLVSHVFSHISLGILEIT
jgi:hypothetical protein